MFFKKSKKETRIGFYHDELSDAKEAVIAACRNLDTADSLSNIKAAMLRLAEIENLEETRECYLWGFDL